MNVDNVDDWDFDRIGVELDAVVALVDVDNDLYIVKKVQYNVSEPMPPNNVEISMMGNYFFVKYPSTEEEDL